MNDDPAAFRERAVGTNLKRKCDGLMWLCVYRLRDG
jgi:hypothetical protein